MANSDMPCFYFSLKTHLTPQVILNEPVHLTQGH